MAEPLRLADLGEWGLIERLRAYAPPGQFDDDGALISPDRDRNLVVTTDLLVEGIHFSDTTMGPEDLGWRAAAANLSDLAAMGCDQVVGLTVGLAAPAETPWAWVEGVYIGLGQALARYGGELLGGDCSGGQQRLLAITALGRLNPARPIRRRDGRPGDLLVSSGPHGLSRLGLALLQGELEPLASTELQDQAIAAHRRPRPRLDGLAALVASQPPGEPWRVAGMDSSDGLAQAVAAIANRSQCQAVLERSQLPLAAAMADLPQAEPWCLGGGEDFELVLALAPAWAEALVEQLEGAQVIGRLEPAQASELRGWDARPLRWADGSALAPADAAGFSHFH